MSGEKPWDGSTSSKFAGVTPLPDRTSPWFQSFTGRKIHPFELRPEDVCIEDIAHHLSLMNRFLGATGVPYSVAQHSIYVSDLLPQELQAWGLLHDSPELYSGIGDVVRPSKRSLVMYACDEDKPLDGWTLSQFEDRLMAVIAERFNLPQLGSLGEDSLARADDTILATERRDVMTHSYAHKWCDLPPPLPRNIEPLDWRVVERIFLDRAEELGIR